MKSYNEFKENLDEGGMGLGSAYGRGERRAEIGRDEAQPRHKSSPAKPASDKIFHKVPFAKKDEAKAEGMRWDSASKKWYHSDKSKSSTSKFVKEEVETLDEAPWPEKGQPMKVKPTITKNKDGSITTTFPDGTWKIESKGYKAEKKPANLVFTHSKSDVEYQNLVYKKGGADNYQLNKEEASLDESERTEKKKSLVSMLDRMAKKADENTKLQKNRAIKKPVFKEEVEELDELSNDLLDRYKKKSGQAASQADKSGDFKTGNKRFSGIVNATKKQFSNDLKEEELDEVLTSKTPAGEVVKDFQKSDAPQFKGKSKEKKQKMAIAAYLDIQRKKIKEEVELAEGRIPVNHVHDAVGEVLGQSSAVKFATNLKAGTSKHTSWKDINSTLVKQGEQPHHIAKITAKLKPAQYESVELEEAKKEPMEVYHPGYSAALQHAEKHLNKKGFEIHPDDWQQHISHGPTKPSEGKTVQLHVPLHKDGKPTKKVAHIQVYNRGNAIPNNNELNMYVN